MDEGEPESDEIDLKDSLSKSCLMIFMLFNSLLSFFYTILEIILLIPCATNKSDVMECVTLKRNAKFCKVLDCIHGTIGCLKLSHKPKLSYHLSISPGKYIPLNL